jgi:hypothetical protein
MCVPKVKTGIDMTGTGNVAKFVMASKILPTISGNIFSPTVQSIWFLTEVQFLGTYHGPLHSRG